jgi:hypothetical protein
MKIFDYITEDEIRKIAEILNIEYYELEKIIDEINENEDIEIESGIKISILENELSDAESTIEDMCYDIRRLIEDIEDEDIKDKLYNILR